MYCSKYKNEIESERAGKWEQGESALRRMREDEWRDRQIHMHRQSEKNGDWVWVSERESLICVWDVLHWRIWWWHCCLRFIFNVCFEIWNWTFVRSSVYSLSLCLSITHTFTYISSQCVYIVCVPLMLAALQHNANAKYSCSHSNTINDRSRIFRHTYAKLNVCIAHISFSIED